MNETETKNTVEYIEHLKIQLLFNNPKKYTICDQSPQKYRFSKLNPFPPQKKTTLLHKRAGIMQPHEWIVMKFTLERVTDSSVSFNEILQSIRARVNEYE